MILEILHSSFVLSNISVSPLRPTSHIHTASNCSGFETSCARVELCVLCLPYHYYYYYLPLTEIAEHSVTFCQTTLIRGVEYVKKPFTYWVAHWRWRWATTLNIVMRHIVLGPPTLNHTEKVFTPTGSLIIQHQKDFDWEPLVAWKMITLIKKVVWPVQRIGAGMTSFLFTFSSK